MEAITSPCSICLAFYRREQDEDCPLHPQASRFWRNRRPDPGPLLPGLPSGWTADGPRFKGEDMYLSCDGDNPEAPWPGYGWPLGTGCWYYVLRGHGRRLFATGLTAESAARRAEQLARET